MNFTVMNAKDYELELNIKKGFRKDKQKRRKLLHVSLQHRNAQTHTRGVLKWFSLFTQNLDYL